MPPSPKMHALVAQKERASELFVDRKEPQALFRNEIYDLCRQSAGIKLLTFYGVGGQGKTALCLQLVKVAGEANYHELGARCAHIDLHKNPPLGEWHTLVALRNAIGEACRASFPCFDLAFADYWELAFPHEQKARLGGHRLAGLGSDVQDSVADIVSGASKDGVNALLDGWAGTVSDIATDIAGGLPFIGQLLKRTSKWAVATGYREVLKRNASALEHLYRDLAAPTSKQILAALPDILAHELSLHLKRKDQKLVLMIDEYENALVSGGATGVLRAGAWDIALREFIACCAHGRHRLADGDQPYAINILLTIFGREKIRWAELDPGWREDLEDRQHLLDGLGRNDALDFLQQAGIAETTLAEAILAAGEAPNPATGKTTIYPLMLDLGVQIYFDSLAAGMMLTPDHFSVSGTSYASKREELFRRLIRNYPEGVEGLLRRLACAGTFDRALAEHLVRTFAIPFDMLHFADIEALSFVTPTENDRSFVLHSHIRDTLLASLSQEDRRAIHRCLAIWFQNLSTPAGVDISIAHAQAFAEAVRQYLAAGDADRDLFERPRSQMLQVVAVATILIAPLEERLAKRRADFHGNVDTLLDALQGLAMVKFAAGAFDEALALDLELLRRAETLSAPESHWLGTAAYNTARDHWQNKNYPEALRLFELSLAERRKIHDESDPAISRTLSGIATTRSAMKQNDEAVEINEKLISLDRETGKSPPDEFALKLYNLSVAYFRLTRFAEARPLLEEALAIQRAALSNDNPHLTGTILNLGLVYLELGLLSEAEPHMEEAVERRRVARPCDSEGLAMSLWGLGKLRHAQGRFAEAHAVHLEALEIRKPLLAPDSSDLLDSEYGVALGLFALGHIAEAELAFVILLEKSPGLEPASRSNVLKDYGDLLMQTWHYEHARRVFEESLAIRRSLFGDDSIWVSGMLIRLGGALAGKLDLQAAADAYHESLKITRLQKTPSDYDLQRALSDLGRVEIIQRNSEAAVGHFREVLAELSRMTTDPQFALSVDVQLANALFQSGDDKQALEIVERTEALAREYAAHSPIFEPMVKLLDAIRSRVVLRAQGLPLRPAPALLHEDQIESHLGLITAGENDWILPPVFPADWQDMGEDDAKPLLSTFARWYPHGPEEPNFLDAFQPQRLRWHRLTCLKTPAYLIEGQGLDNGRPAIFLGLWSDNDFRSIAGDPLGQTDWLKQLGLVLDTPEHRRCYANLLAICISAAQGDGEVWTIRWPGDTVGLEHRPPEVRDLIALEMAKLVAMPLDHQAAVEGPWEMPFLLVLDGGLARMAIRLASDGAMVFVGTGAEEVEYAGPKQQRWHGSVRVPVGTPAVH